MTSKTIYAVADVESTPVIHRLVKASSRAQAVRHVVGKRFIADVAEPQTLIDLTKAGVEVEVAGGEEEAAK